MIIDIYWEKTELVSVKKAAIELKVPHIIGSPKSQIATRIG